MLSTLQYSLVEWAWAKSPGPKTMVGRWNMPAVVTPLGWRA